ncbi:hypothetical protein COCMIDRAFT_22033 [Bipolaris oryzae ATCC 44560]|uniref:Uncharacterized protein n=1 Tax=Bipolaris oryzae ATCC 44560 TaxID=930090 RepID=W6ZK25_COCMI|nr:uncharacterized protein COCMIDRAFT_22033 [Bipolaris oryzae ATCC 44560]EUC50420.1 hypothetical protein COCMIDRAFT_22033 [Bipolaris oryzae ATCC 44560]
MSFAHGISQEEQEGIYQDICNRNDPTSLIEGFTFGREDPSSFPREAIGTEAYVKKGWHEPGRCPHFTVELRYVFLQSRWYKKYRDQKYIFWDTRFPRPENVMEPPGGPLPRYAFPHKLYLKP